MATKCPIQKGFVFQPKLSVDFEGGDLTSDAGLVVVREFDERLGLTRSLRAAVRDERDPRYVTHEILTLLRQRLYQIVAGYEDANDADRLRHDPTLQTVAHRPGLALASQPTFSRLENAADWQSIHSLSRASLEWFCEHVVPRRKRPAELVLDVDSTDDPTHGQQVLSFFNGHYDEHMYHPLLVFEGQTGHLLGARLRPGNEGGARRLRPMLETIARRLKRAFPKTEIALRADGGFCNPEILDYAERAGLTYAIGLPRNSVLERQIEKLRARARATFERAEKPVRLFSRFWYRSGSWRYSRWVAAKIEHTALGSNVRFVVSNRPGSGEEIFTWYNQRGQAENFIKELKRDLAADRLSCHEYRANAFRLQLHALAYNLLTMFRRAALSGTELARSTLGTLRLRLLKVGARVRRSARRLWYHLPTGWPGRELYLRVLERLRAMRCVT